MRVFPFFTRRSRGDPINNESSFSVYLAIRGPGRKGLQILGEARQEQRRRQTLEGGAKVEGESNRPEGRLFGEGERGSQEEVA